ncbi:cardiolipin synthase (CMP-forming)-like [Stylophora pistillata]|uniref:cardiolipin synthase (CMP-forming) n=1 Tax=Stylophora pistillata TaxID=50429 RepID=A0A2B4RMH2_STYPI|nr:cardiolipin synthase (CMP-forming)-like [Stylophora pistillata]PFX17710.1 Cardiolipin synthase [Stylophora pistillata]
MAAVCGTCQTLRLTSTLERCFSSKFLHFKQKSIIPAAYVSNFSFFGHQRSSEDRYSGSFVWQPGNCVPEHISTFWKLKGSRTYKFTSFHFQRDVEEPGKIKPVSGKIKARLEKIKEMKEDIYTVPNLLSTLRILLTPVLGYLIVSEDFVSSLTLFGVAGITDMLDGFIARNFKNQKSVLGTVLDPLADKILMSVLTVSLTVVSLLPVSLTALILSRDALLIGYAFYLRYNSLPSPKTISRYFDFNFPTVELRPNFLGKANTVLQLALVGCSLAAPVFGFVDHPHLQYLWYTVAASTVMSSISYLINFRGSVKYLK